MNNEEEEDNTSEIKDEVQPDWMEAIRRNANFSETLEEFKFDDGVKIILKTQQPLLKKSVKNTEQPKTI